MLHLRPSLVANYKMRLVLHPFGTIISYNFRSIRCRHVKGSTPHQLAKHSTITLQMSKNHQSLKLLRGHFLMGKYSSKQNTVKEST